MPSFPKATYRLPVSQKPIWMGILNLTPDSFSKASRFTDPAAAEAHALHLEARGAQILDIGAESTRPGHTPVSSEEELRRLLPVLEHLAGKLRIPISIDTRNADVARAAFDCGAQMLNDVSALSGPGMTSFVQSGDFPVVLMHGVAHTLPEHETHPSEAIAHWLSCHMEHLDIARERIILDPGIGFGTTREQDAAILDNLSPLKALGFPLLIGLSRKRIVQHLYPTLPLDVASEKMAHQAWQNGATILRMH